jgi:hypothetical protein
MDVSDELSKRDFRARLDGIPEAVYANVYQFD